MDKHQDENEENNENASETVNQKRILLTEIQGKVKWFNVKLGYGFVCRNDNQEDVFIHQSAIVKSNPEHPRKSVEDGEEILFDIVQGIKGNEAANVCGADGNCVKGSEYALRYPRGRGRGRGSYRGRGDRIRIESTESGVRTQDYYRGGNRGRPYRGNRPNVTQNRSVKKDEHEVNELPNEKPLICTGITGKVKWFNVKRAYGFVCRNDNQEDIFIHQSAIAKSNPDHPRKSVEDGEEILFDIVQGAKGYEAANVSAVDGKCVKGSEYALRFQRGGGRGRGRGRPRGRGSFRGGRGKSRDVSEDDEMAPPHEFYRGQPPPMQRGRPFYPRRPFPRPYRGGAGGRPFGVPPFIDSYNYEVPPEYFYEFEPAYYDPMRSGPRGRFNGPRFRGGGPPRDAMPMKMGVFEGGEYFDRRPPPNNRGGGGRPRSRGRMPMRGGGGGRGGGRARGRGDQWAPNRGGDGTNGGTPTEPEQRQQQRGNGTSTNNNNDTNND